MKTSDTSGIAAVAAYKIVGDHDPDTLAEKVQFALAAGWQLQGGLSVTICNDGDQYVYYYAQAMVKE